MGQGIIDHRDYMGKESKARAKESVTKEFEDTFNRKGDHALGSTHEILGIVTCQYTKLLNTMVDDRQIADDLIKLAAACMVGLASMANKSLDW